MAIVPGRDFGNELLDRLEAALLEDLQKIGGKDTISRVYIWETMDSLEGSMDIGGSLQFSQIVKMAEILEKYFTDISPGQEPTVDLPPPIQEAERMTASRQTAELMIGEVNAPGDRLLHIAIRVYDQTSKLLLEADYHPAEFRGDKWVMDPVNPELAFIADGRPSSFSIVNRQDRVVQGGTCGPGGGFRFSAADVRAGDPVALPPFIMRFL